MLQEGQQQQRNYMSATLVLLPNTAAPQRKSGPCEDPES
jgi:hypothetical protein